MVGGDAFSGKMNEYSVLNISQYAENVVYDQIINFNK